MIPPQDFVQALKDRGWRFFTGVPCSFFQSAINCVRADRDLRYLNAVNEGAALALAAGADLAGSPAVVMLQNSGLGNLINPLTSLNMIYNLPALIFVSGRAYGVPDEPQHEIIGRTMGDILKSIGVSASDLPQEPAAYAAALDRARGEMTRSRQPYVFFVRKDTVGIFENSPAVGAADYSLSRMAAIRVVADCLQGGEIVVATTGMPARELFSVQDRPGNFYMQGSMGHAASIGLGIALARPEKKVVVLDGDGALLMHMGILSTIGNAKPENLYHIVLDNEAYETTGNQDTTSSTTDFCAAAKACEYNAALLSAPKGGLPAQVQAAEDELRSKVKTLLAQKGPALLHVKIHRVTAEKSARITTKYTCAQITENFKKSLGDPAS